MRCTCTNVSCERVFCLHFPVGCREFLSPSQRKLVLTLRKIFHEWSDHEEWQEFQPLLVHLLRSQFVDEDDASLLNSSPFEDRLLQFLRTLVLLVSLVGFEDWFYIPAGTLPFIRRVISCILFSREQTRVVVLTVAEHHPDSILESNVLNFDFSQLLFRRMNDLPRQFCQIA